MSGWPPGEPAAGEALPLAGLRVLDLSRILAGPFASMVLSDLGADVIKIERPGTGDDTRRWGPPFRNGVSTYFMSINRNRRSLTLNLESEAGREILNRLAADAHVVLENFLPQQLVSLGLTAVRDDNPHLAWVSIRAASSDGPLGARPGFDAMVQARSGLMSITGDESHATKVGVAIADVIAGLHAVIAVLTLLLAKRTFVPDPAGAASAIEVPLLECALTALVNQASNYLIAGITPGRLGNAHPNLVPYMTYACSDRELLVGAGTDRQFSNLASTIGRPDLVKDPLFATNAVRIENRDELDALIGSILATEPRSVWGERFDAAGVPWAPLNDIAEAFNEEHVSVIGLVSEIAHGHETIAQVRSPFLIDGRRPQVRSAPPDLGEHTSAILTHLGYGDRIEELRKGGVL
jgi:crotonobetainyl-CoA:carnitine CoA-transferase CaiB-like acyl-CoA transferase